MKLKLLTLALPLAVLSATAFARPIAAIGDGNDLYFFDSNTPNAIPVVVDIVGLQAGETLLGIDTRPATGALFALGSTGRLYTIGNGVGGASVGGATQIGAGGLPVVGGASYGFDFNPVPDRIRVVNDNDDSLRLNPIDGTLAGTDTSLTPAGDKVAAAYDRPDTDAATATTLFVLDATSNTLARVGDVNGTPSSPNAGIVTDIGPLGVDIGTATGFDIAFDGEASVSSNGSLYRLNLGTGAATLVGALPAGITDITYVPFIPNLGAGQVIPTLSPGTLAALMGALGLLGLVALRRRA